MERKGIIYRAFCKITGKSYIGQTVQKFRERFYKHYSDSKRDKTNNNILSLYVAEDFIVNNTFLSDVLIQKRRLSKNII